MTDKVKTKVGLHLDDDKWWTLRSRDKSSLIKDSPKDNILVDRLVEGTMNSYKPRVLLLPLELML